MNVTIPPHPTPPHDQRNISVAWTSTLTSHPTHPTPSSNKNRKTQKTPKRPQNTQVPCSAHGNYIHTRTHTHIYIFQASDLGLVKDTPVWPSPISSCVGPPLHKSQLIRCPYKIRNYVWFFLVRHGPLVKPWWHRTCSPLVTYDFVHQVLCVYVM